MCANLSGAAAPGDPTRYQHHYPALLFGVLLIVVTVCGNVLVVVSVHLEKALKTTTNYFIVSLAVADLMLAVLVLPLFVYSEFQGGLWSLDMGVCDGLMTMDVLLCTASIFNLCAISIDRFIAVSVPLNYNRRHVDQRQTVLLAATWVLALAVAAPVMFGVNDVPGRRPGECKLENDDYVLYSSVCSFFIPCPIMLLLYCAMFRGLRQWEEARRVKLRSSIQACRRLQEAASSLPVPVPATAAATTAAAAAPPAVEPDPATADSAGEGEEGGLCSPALSPSPGRRAGPARSLTLTQVRLPADPNRKKRAKINGRERKAMRVLPVVVGTFLFCWTPFFVVHTMRARCYTCSVPPGLMSVVTWLGYVNSALNPVIYTVFNTEFRKFFKKCLHGCCL